MSFLNRFVHSIPPSIATVIAFSFAYLFQTRLCSVALAILSRIQKITSPIFQINKLPENGVVGTRPFSSKVRLIYVNGLSTDAETSRRTAETISHIYDDSFVHYTYLPLRFDQVFRSIVSGYRPDMCDMLLQNIRDRLSEVGPEAPQTPAGGPAPNLYIFAHSGGGAMVRAACNGLTAEERRRIVVYTFGSAHQFSSAEGFADVRNVAARGDPIPNICRLVNRMMGHAPEVWNVGGPRMISIADHSIRGGVYEHAMWQLRVNTDP